MADETEENEEDLVVDENDEYQESKPAPLFNWKRFVYIFLGMLTLMVFIDPDLRFEFGAVLGTVLYPVIGFEGEYPILTLMFGGIIMTIFSTLVRDRFMDWVDMAETQKKVSAFQKELNKARMANQNTKVKKMQELQPEVSSMQMETFKPQMKSMVLTMIVIISIFGWLWMFVQGLPNKSFSVPWQLNANLMKPLIKGCFMPFPQWLGVYVLLSVPLGQMLTVVLKYLDFRKRLP
ncbi:MAG: EMC3/TMCO1 family protein [Thermoplasmata archaeon]